MPAADTINEGTARIRALNDALRQTFVGGRVMMTQRVQALSPDQLAELIAKVQGFDAFSSDNDPWGEHDFGAVTMASSRWFWKIDTYDPSLSHHADDPSDPRQTVRVLTLMHADEY